MVKEEKKRNEDGENDKGAIEYGERGLRMVQFNQSMQEEVA